MFLRLNQDETACGRGGARIGTQVENKLVHLKSHRLKIRCNWVAFLFQTLKRIAATIGVEERKSAFAVPRNFSRAVSQDWLSARTCGSFHIDK
jgi:hypothetical protein